MVFGSSEVIEGRRRDVGTRAAVIMGVVAIALPAAVAAITRAFAFTFIGLRLRIPPATAFWLRPVGHAVVAVVLLALALLAVRLRAFEVFALTAAFYVLATAVLLLLPVLLTSGAAP